eukprot:COSAG02_NODE_7991_length_2756_cov_2.043658_2_plen_51_part_00
MRIKWVRPPNTVFVFASVLSLVSLSLSLSLCVCVCVCVFLPYILSLPMNV